MTKLEKVKVSDELLGWEAVIIKGMEHFVQVGTALRNIRDSGLYKERQYTSFKAYCLGEFDYSEQRVYQLIDASDYRRVLPDSTMVEYPWNERQLREFKRIETQYREHFVYEDETALRQDALDAARRVGKAIETAVKEGGVTKVTAKVCGEFVDAELLTAGVEVSNSKPATKVSKDVERAKLNHWLIEQAGSIQGMLDVVLGVDDWTWFARNKALSIEDVIKSCSELAAFLRKVLKNA